MLPTSMMQMQMLVVSVMASELQDVITMMGGGGGCRLATCRLSLMPGLITILRFSRGGSCVWKVCGPSQAAKPADPKPPNPPTPNPLSRQIRRPQAAPTRPRPIQAGPAARPRPAQADPRRVGLLGGGVWFVLFDVVGRY